MKEKVLIFIRDCNLTFGKYQEFSGGCYKFSLLLISVFGGDMYWSHDHIITKIEGYYYDIDGFYAPEEEFFLVGGPIISKEELEKKYKEYL